MAKRTMASWEVSEEFWKRVEPLVPGRQRAPGREYARQPGGGRKPKDARLVFAAIVYVLRTGCQWKALPQERFGSASAIHKRFLEWEHAGCLREAMAGGPGGIRRHGGHCLALAKRRRGVGEGPVGARVGRTQSDGSGKKMGASECCWSTRVAARSRPS